MNLNTPNFLFLFFPLFILVYSLVKKQLKLMVGIAGSLLFYSWGNSQYLFLMVGLTLFAYLTARGIDQWRGGKISLVLFWTGILLILAVLIGFKLRTDAAYPLGLSYVTFQIIAYLVEVYRRENECEKDILKFSFYLLLFPKIPVGPIARYSQVKAQISDLHVDPQEMAEGLRRFLVGFAKKALIADTLATVVTPIFNLQSPVVSPSIAWLVIISYSLQLYFDFSGYTDMALGIARMMGIRFMENFNFPYISRSISDFWRRWHISLSNWFRDMVFYPLERRRLKWSGQQINILIVFALTGLWHGMTRNFLIWGLIHGLAIVFESTFAGRKLRNFWAPIQHLYALSVILVGWVFFRSPTPDFALDFLRRLAGNTNGIQALPFEQTSPLPFIEPSFLLALLIGLMLCLPVGAWFQALFPKIYENHELKNLPLQIVYDAVLILVFLFALAATASATYQPAIYGTF
jgi:alginate O-acetyltransferase complex protein AlgI